MFSNLHIYKTNSVLQAVATGVESTNIEVFVEHHKGLDPTNPDQLSTPGATVALVIYSHFFWASAQFFLINFKWFACYKRLMVKK
jgi:hypothetical protein